jgi:hypothetical protein
LNYYEDDLTVAIHFNLEDSVVDATAAAHELARLWLT